MLKARWEAAEFAIGISHHPLEFESSLDIASAINIDGSKGWSRRPWLKRFPVYSIQRSILSQAEGGKEA